MSLEKLAYWKIESLVGVLSCVNWSLRFLALVMPDELRLTLKLELRQVLKKIKMSKLHFKILKKLLLEYNWNKIFKKKMRLNKGKNNEKIGQK